MCKRFHSLLIWGKLFLWGMYIKKCFAELEIWHKQTLCRLENMPDDGYMITSIIHYENPSFQMGQGGIGSVQFQLFYLRGSEGTVKLCSGTTKTRRKGRGESQLFRTPKISENGWKLQILQRFIDRSYFDDEKRHRFPRLLLLVDVLGLQHIYQ